MSPRSRGHPRWGELSHHLPPHRVREHLPPLDLPAVGVGQAGRRDDLADRHVGKAGEDLPLEPARVRWPRMLPQPASLGQLLPNRARGVVARTQTRPMEYDPTQYLGSARHYLAGRPPYSAELGTVLAAELGLDGAGRLLDVGSGPGVLAVQLAGLFEHVTALEPDPDMLAEAREHAAANGVGAVDFILAMAEDIPGLGLPPMRVATFGQSFHRTDRDAVAEAVYQVLEPGGAIALIVHDPDASAAPAGPGDPPIPDDEVQALISRYLGSERRSGQCPASWYGSERLEAMLARTSFGAVKTLHAPGRPDITRDVDGVISGYLSMSYAAPHLLGDRLDAFVADLRRLLEARTTTGRFWDWPGDTAVIIGRKPGCSAPYSAAWSASAPNASQSLPPHRVRHRRPALDPPAIPLRQPGRLDELADRHVGEPGEDLPLEPALVPLTG
jgi:SAM-dependent methyltransferase